MGLPPLRKGEIWVKKAHGPAAALQGRGIGNEAYGPAAAEAVELRAALGAGCELGHDGGQHGRVGARVHRGRGRVPKREVDAPRPTRDERERLPQQSRREARCGCAGRRLRAAGGTPLEGGTVGFAGLDCADGAHASSPVQATA